MKNRYRRGQFPTRWVEVHQDRMIPLGLGTCNLPISNCLRQAPPPCPLVIWFLGCNENCWGLCRMSGVGWAFLGFPESSWAPASDGASWDPRGLSWLSLLESKVNFHWISLSFWLHFGSILNPFGAPFLAHFGPLGAPWAVLGAPWLALGARGFAETLLGAKSWFVGPPLGARKRPQNRCKN